MTRELVMLTRTLGCYYVRSARRALEEAEVPYREINVDRDPVARERLLAWVGFLSVPTLFLAEPGQDTPAAEPEPLPPGQSPRGIDRGSMLTEPTPEQLAAWLRRHGLLKEDGMAV